MTDITYISPELMMEGTLDVTASSGASVILAGHFKGEMRASDIELEATSLFDGKIVAESVIINGKVKGEVEARRLKLASTAKFDGTIRTDELAIDIGAEVSGSIARTAKT